ncbi:Rieske (2Fe-2S) protein [Haloglomus irregulare]|uniref:Rieske (2Fe-2S) protein n=1 Tax=Haloglomus irregulare TaxID=2234134 RepID=A0A554MWM3_9EURY|nr:Rieske 2Fe-2S domain-containing protein [Haloglomus irregulare]TSD09526.1 Rieske (2Fe-2S) protein [Haloglomus irregulare]
MEVSDDQRICDAEDVPEAGTFLFTYRDGFDVEEALLVRLGGGDDEAGIACWKNYCQHWTDVRLDKGDGARVRDGELWCNKHAATFRPDDGVCTYGPCEGAVLDEVEVTVHDEGVYLTDDRYEFDGLGPDGDRDLSTGSPGGRIDFTGS